MTAKLYDLETALREVARHRQRRDEPTQVTTELADDLASHVAAHFGPEAHETAGLALVLASASIGGLAATLRGLDGKNGWNGAGLLCNVLSFAGQRLVLDARAAENPSNAETCRQEDQ